MSHPSRQEPQAAAPTPPPAEQRSVLQIIKSSLRPLMSRAIRFILDRPFLSRRISRLLKTYPALFGRLKAFAVHRGIVEPEFVNPAPDDITQASARVTTVYSVLKKGFEEKERH